jgi:hypothetical protein
VTLLDLVLASSSLPFPSAFPAHTLTALAGTDRTITQSVARAWAWIKVPASCVRRLFFSADSHAAASLFFVLIRVMKYSSKLEAPKGTGSFLHPSRPSFLLISKLRSSRSRVSGYVHLRK